MKALFARARAGVRAVAADVGAAARAPAGRLAARGRSALAVVRLAWHVKAAAAVGLAVGLAAMAAATLSHPLATALSGAGTAAVAFAAHLGLWVRSTVRPWTA